MKICHTVNYAPGFSGMYGSVRDLVLEERRRGHEAEVVNDTGESVATPGEDGIVPVPSSYGDKADIICWHHATSELWLNEPHRNLVLFLHGTPEFNFYTELHEPDEKVFSLLVGAANKKIPKAFITMWERHVPIWESFLKAKVHFIPSWVNLDEWRVSPRKTEKDTIRIAMMDFWRLTREPFGLIAALECLRRRTKKKIEVNVWGITGIPNDTYKAAIQYMVEDGVMFLRGNTKDPMADIYHKNDLVITMSTEETRVVRESMACGVPALCGRGPLGFTKYSVDCIDPIAFSNAIEDCHDDLTVREDDIRKDLRAYAEQHMNVKSSGDALLTVFEEILEKHGSPNHPKFVGAVRPVASVNDTCAKLYQRLSNNEATCFLRFGDGDILVMNGQDDSLQKGGESLRRELIEAFTHREEGYLVASVAGQVNEGRMRKGLFAAPEQSTQMLSLVQQLRPNETLDNAIALAYQSVFEPEWFIDFLRKCVHGKRVLFIGGEVLCRSVLVKQVFDVTTFFPLPMTNAYGAIIEKMEDIKREVGTHEVVICAAGLSTRVLGKRLWTQGFRVNFLDIGSIADALAGIESRTWTRLLDMADYRRNFEVSFMPMKTDIVVLSYKQEEKTIQCFQSIAEHTKNYRVIWVDNGSGSDSIEKVKLAAAKLADCDLIAVPKNEGFSKGVNRALRKIIAESDAKYVVLMNNDVVVTPRWLEGMVAAQVTSGLDAIGPVTSEGNPHSVDALRSVCPTLPAFTNETLSERSSILRTRNGVSTLEANNMLSFFCCLLRKEAIEQTGLLDENMFAYGEDNDYFERMKRTGKKYGIALGVYVHHDHAATSGQMGEGWKEKQQKVSRQYLAKKWEEKTPAVQGPKKIPSHR